MPLHLTSGPSPAPRCARLSSAPTLSIFSVLIASLFATNTAHAQLLPNMAAPADQRPVLLTTASGIAQIDITRPSTAGVSVNQFRQFDIASQGAVINNGRTASSTSLAGWVAANPALLAGAAKVIVNEIRSNDPSLLNGYIEIAGGKADVVIANPAGIHCRGCGFIHAAQVALATGKPNIEDGKLTGYQVGQGTLEIAGRGLDASRVDALSLLSRAVRVNAGIWAHDLKLALNAPARSPNDANAPVFALDVADIGGMYANRIWLVGSAQGLGVRNAGHWSASDTLVVSIDGRLENSGSMDARALTVQATTLDNVARGKLLGERIVLQADHLANAGHPDASPVIAAAADLDIAVRVLENTDQAMIFSGGVLGIGGQIGSEGRATGEASLVLNRAAHIESLGNASIGASRLQNLNAGIEIAEILLSGPRRLAYVQPFGESRKYLPEELEAAGFGKIFKVSRTEYIVDRSEFGSQLISSRPARILSGGHLQLTGMDMLNENSQIMVAGDLTGTWDKLQTVEARGTKRIHEVGTSQSIVVVPIFDFGYLEVRGPVLPYTPADEISTQRLLLSDTADNGTGKPAGPAIDSALRRLTADGDSLFRHQPGGDPPFVTDPRVTQYRQWLNSDAMLTPLAYDPERLQKRIGDGYLEQRLVREQIAQLTGRRFLPGQDNDEAPYAAMIASGVHQAGSWQLQPGIALTASQVAKLTADIIWLVEQDIDLPAHNGQSAQTVRALVPQVYLLPRSGDLAGSGTLISAQRVALSVADAIDNAGTIKGTDGLQLQARTISNKGTLSGSSALLVATEDIHMEGGEVNTRHQQQLVAGRDIRIASSMRDSALALNMAGATTEAARVGINRIAMLQVSEQGKLALQAGRDIALDGATLLNQGTDEVHVLAGRDLSLGSLTTRSSFNASERSTANALREGQSGETGTTIQADGSVLLGAGQDLSARAATVTSQDAGTVLAAGRDLSLTAGGSGQSYAQGVEFRNRTMLSSSTSTLRAEAEQHDAVASVVSGNTVDLLAGRNLAIVGSDVAGHDATRLRATRDIHIEAATESSDSTFFSRTTHSGLISGPGLAIGIGSQRQQQSSATHRTRLRSSQVGALAGDVSMVAAQAYRQQASNLMAPQGSVGVTAHDITISGSTNTTESRQQSTVSQSGISIALSNPVIDTARALDNLQHAHQSTRSSHAQALAAAASGLAIINTTDQVTRDPAHLGGLTVAITMGGSKAESRTTESIATVVPSLVMAGKNITIQAAGKPESRLSVQGSQVRAGDMVTLEAAGDLLLQAQANTTRQTMDSDSRGGGIGLALSMGRQGVGVGLIGNTAQGKGRASGEAIEWSPTAIEAGRRASLISGGNTELSGGMVKAPGVDVTVGRDLNIESLQDRRHYESHQQTIAASIAIPATSSAGASAQVNATKSDIRSDYVSTTGVTGIQAGDDGFRGDVAGAAQLKGASITSTDRAVETGVNHFSSASLTLSDLTNRADYTAQGAGMGIGMGVNPQGDYAPKGSHAGLGKESGHQAGVTVAGISDIAGNKAVRTGDPATGVARIFDAERIAKEINAQVTMTQEFTGNAYRAVDNYVSQNRKALQLALKEARDSDVTQELNARLSQLRREEQVMNILIGSLAGMGGAAVTKEGLSSAAEKMRALMMEDSERFAGVTDGRTVISNVSGESEGVRSDGIKLGGTRIDPDLLCGKNNEHCEVIRDAKGHPVLDTNGKTTLALNDQQMIVFMTSKKYPSLQSYLDSSDGLKMYGSTGGIQGYRGTFFGVEYKPGSWQDRLIEAFSGTHDLIGGRTFHLYDDRGNAKRGMSDSERAAQNVWSTLAIVPSSPFAVAELFPASVWQALSILVQAAR